MADYQAFALTAFCQACDRSVLLDQQALADRYGWDVLLEELRRRLRCAKRGRRPKRRAAVPDGEMWPFVRGRKRGRRDPTWPPTRSQFSTAADVKTRN